MCQGNCKTTHAAGFGKVGEEIIEGSAPFRMEPANNPQPTKHKCTCVSCSCHTKKG